MHSTVLFTPARKTHTGKTLLSFPFDLYGLLLILNGLSPPGTSLATCRCTLSYPNCLHLKLLKPCSPLDAKRPLNWSQHLYASLSGESASSSNIHRAHVSPGILMDPAPCGWEQMCQAWSKTRPTGTVYELCYGTGCENG